MTRKEAIGLLSGLMFKGKLKEALQMAISSLETDEAYQLEYERTTKNDLGVDCISRKAVLGCLYSTLESYHIKRNIMDLPSVYPKSDKPSGKWIPVSEKLPNDRDWYLGIFKEIDTGWVNPLPFICDYVGRETKATTKEFWILRGFTDIDNPCEYYQNLKCVAWQPLPAPYRVVEQTGENT